MVDAVTARDNVAELPVKRRHRWIKWPTQMPDASKSGCEEHGRACVHCHVSAITFIPPSGRLGDIYTRWTLPDGTVLDYSPPCTGMKEGEW